MTGCVLSFLGFFSSVFAQNIYMLYVTYGFVAGLGASLSGLSTSVIIQQHFHKHRNVATSVSMCGIPIGNFISPIITNFFLKSFGWRGAIAMQSAIRLNTLALTMLFTPVRKQAVETRLKQDESAKEKPTINSFCRNLFDCSIMRDPAFVIFVFGVLLARFSLSAFINHTPSRAVYEGSDMDSAGYLVTLYCLGSFTCRILCSILMGLTKGINPLLGYSIIILSQGVLTFGVTFSSTYLGVAICTTLFGCCQGFTAPFSILSTVKLAGVKRYGKARALCNLVAAFGSFAATPLTGFIFDVSQNYDTPFYFSGTVGLVGFCLMFTTFITYSVQKRKQKETKVQEEENFYNLETQRLRAFTC